MSKWKDHEEIKIFREYLRIPSVQPGVNYDPCITFLKKQAASLDLPMQIFYPGDENKPLAVITWLGNKPDLSSILLNSHMDVAPVFEEKWAHPPFAADVDEKGRIYARGAQAMKSVAMQYLAAVRKLKSKGVTLTRTIHIVFAPDKEINGASGMKSFVQSDDFKNLNVGFALDEGMASGNDTFLLFNTERPIWRVHFLIRGTTGPKLLLHANTVGEKLRNIMNKATAFRNLEARRLVENPRLSVGDVSTINLTSVQAEHENGMVSYADVCFDIRLEYLEDHRRFERKLQRWALEAGHSVELFFEHKEPVVPATGTKKHDTFWRAIEKCLKYNLHFRTRTAIQPGDTDSRHFRRLGIPAIGFSPIINTPMLAHDHNEFLKAKTYLRGIDIYVKLIAALGNA